MKNKLYEDESQMQTIDYIYEEFRKEFDLILNKCQAFDHCTYIIDYYYNFKTGLKEQINKLDPNTRLSKQLRQLDDTSEKSLEIINMLNEYEEYRFPSKVQLIKTFKSFAPKAPQKKKTVKLCESLMIEENQAIAQNNLRNSQLQVIQEENLIEDEVIPNQFEQEVVESEIHLKNNFHQNKMNINPEQEEINQLEIRMEQAKGLYQEALLDEAFEITQDIFLKLNNKQAQWFKEKGYQEFYENLQEKKLILTQNLNELESGGWRIEKQTQNLIIKYKLFEEESTVTVYLDSVFEANITKLMALINEIDLYHNYVPFCQRSSMNKQLTKTCKICDIVVYFPFISDRRAVFVGEGIDRLMINGTIVFVCKSIDHNIDYQQKHDIHFETNKKLVSLIINYYIFELTPINDNKCRVRAITNSNPQVKYLPNWLIGYLARKMAHELFERMERITKNFEKSPWFEKYNQNIEFYKWIDQKVQKYFELRQK
ncbi:unnamed protein product (macronuclear) [Paramecium tetraurelia]|uniref:START domain-containing protein n=1 Tax=Paramecium tetraurelia TaxID=5888 RepID=A0EDI5_PARTE|nr:uncharacterized protein GSPATT00004221001 [Paramecium tetraurelia]CAK93352.1 unnamed protein product [Paramecium tetraurelia]|eukprot:XP_001460749.1 hypothetical protein (macronuclear) [Paramecium tetraurelia strain d4-2]